MDSLDDALCTELADLEAQSLRRRLRRTESPPGPHVVLEGRAVIQLGSNNYLGLAEHPAVLAAGQEAIRKWGAGGTGSRLTSGNSTLHEDLEAELAALQSCDAALLFPTGYQAAVGTIPALVGRGDLILSDALNHACLIDGCRLSRAELRVYRHADVDHAAELLRDRSSYRRVLLLTDGVFSMDGDLAPLPALAGLCAKTDGWLMVDDAHGTGVLGSNGGGIVEHFGLEGRVPVRMGTLSKALGSEGGFIAGSRVLIEYLRSRARSFIFTTAAAPAAIGAALAAVRIAQADPGRRARLGANVEFLRGALKYLGFPVLQGPAPIIPLRIGAAADALEFARLLEERGVWAPAIRPPTVPEGTSRLRLTVTASHTRADLEAATGAICEIAEDMGIL
jgi:8-amino-7-oxononanoate synthase